MEQYRWTDWFRSFVPPAIVLAFISILAVLGIWAWVWMALWILAVLELLNQLLRLAKRMFWPSAFRRKTWGQKLASAAVWTAIVIFSAPLMIVAAAKLSQSATLKTAADLKSAEAQIARVGNFIDYRGQVHVHSYLSHDSEMKLKDIAKAAKGNGIRWVILTDHISCPPPGEPPREIDGVVFIYGSERDWRRQGSHLRVPIDGSPRFRAYGHLEKLKSWRGDEQWDAIELVNFHGNCNKNAGKLIVNVLCRPREVYRPLTAVLPENLERWQELSEREGRPIPIFAGPDAHENVRLLGIQLDPCSFMLGLVSTHVLVDKEKPLNEDSVLEALKRGRSYIVFDYLGNPTGFNFCVQRGPEQFPIGSVVANPDFLFCDNSFKWDFVVKAFCDNRLIATWDQPPNITIAPLSPGFWRVEIWRHGMPWIISGQILVR